MRDLNDWELRTAMRLRAHLQARVPLLMRFYRRKGGPDEKDLERVRGYAKVIGEFGDLILFPDGKGKDKDLLEKLAEGVAVLSFAPLGVTVFGLHYDASELPPEEEEEDELTLKALVAYFDGLFDDTWHERYSKN